MNNKNNHKNNNEMSPRIKNHDVINQVRTIKIIEHKSIEQVCVELLKVGLKDYWERKMVE